MSAQRKTNTARWSAKSTLTAMDAEGQKVPLGDPSTIKVVARWRYDGKGRKMVFSGPNAVGDAAGFQGLLLGAAHKDWPADTRGRPIVPDWATGTVLTAPANETPTGLRATMPIAGAPPVLPTMPRAGMDIEIRNLEQLVAWYVVLQTSTKKKRGGQERSPNTTGGYENELNFFLKIACYPHGDPRLEASGCVEGDSLRIDDPAFGVNEFDLIDLVYLREAVNLRTRSANENAMKRWAAKVEKEHRLAAKQGREPVIPDPPTPTPEVAMARTIESFARTVRAIFTEGVRRRKISYQPWTAEVDDVVVHAGPVNYNLSSVLNQEQVTRTGDMMAALERASTDPQGKHVVVSGKRYEAMVLLAGRKAPRPEETIAIRDSWVHLDDERPRITLEGGEVYHPKEGGGRQRTKVNLKGRPPGSIRVLGLSGEPELVELLRHHRDEFVATADPNSDDPDVRDPYFFTSHRGLPIDLSDWGSKWWKPAIAAALTHPDEALLAMTPFRRLRAAAITSWLAAGRTLFSCANEAGNSQAVIEKHYAGVLAEIGYDPQTGHVISKDQS